MKVRKDPVHWIDLHLKIDSYQSIILNLCTGGGAGKAVIVNHGVEPQPAALEEAEVLGFPSADYCTTTVFLTTDLCQFYKKDTKDFA